MTDLMEVLHDDLWVLHKADHFARFQRDRWMEKDGRVLSNSEWKLIKDQIVERGLLVTPGNSPFGFSFAIDIWEPAPPAPYPGTEEAFKPKHLLSVTTAHMTKVMGSGRGPELTERFWSEIIEPLVFTEDNLKRLEENGFEAPRDKSYYDY